MDISPDSSLPGSPAQATVRRYDASSFANLELDSNSSDDSDFTTDADAALTDSSGSDSAPTDSSGSD
jgi:hypothetical protein